MKRLVLAMVLVAGCGDTINNTYVNSDGGGGSTNDAAGTCTPNAKECATAKVARICAPDGTGWVQQQCDFGEVCSGGDCTVDPNVQCTPGVDVFCLDSTHTFVCNDNGMGFKTVACPANTNCGGGVCVGSCNVGESFCLDTNTVVTCTDGFTYSSTTCNRGSTACVATGTSPVNTAACMPAQCTPDPNGCDDVCGNKALGAGNTDSGFISFCQETSLGYKWAAIQCPSSTTCNPSGAACTGMNGGTMATCTSECTTGEVRCTPDGLGTQVCTAGKWGATTSCNPTPTGDAQACVQMGSTAVCGDPICAAGAAGACETDGFHPCVNGRVSGTVQACAMGTCVTDPNLGTIGKYTAGLCQAECQNGDKRCTSALGSNSFQTCGANGLWSSTAMTCASGACFDFTDPTSGRPNAVCGVCAPGTHRCTNSTGGAGNTHIETCSATGTWGTQAACTVGSCIAAGSGNDAACLAECPPNQTVCMGAGMAIPGTSETGFAQVGTCSATGTLPGAPTNCTGTTFCRLGRGGAPVSTMCIECVGPNITGGNSLGLVDTRCGGGGVEVCTAGNTWPVSGTACPGATSCIPENPSAGGTCGDCPGFPGSGPCSETIYGPGICNFFGGAPISCGTQTDCCDVSCTGLAPAPATCQ